MESDNTYFFFQTIKPLFEEQIGPKAKELIMNNLRPMVLQGRIKTITHTCLQELIDYYEADKEFLYQLIINLSLEYMDQNIIKEKCQLLEIYSPLIYIFQQSDKDNYSAFFIIFNQLFKLHNNKQPDTTKILNTVHYILWFTRSIAQGFLFPNREMQPAQY